jgi:hypothetical protein
MSAVPITEQTVVRDSTRGTAKILRQRIEAARP